MYTLVIKGINPNLYYSSLVSNITLISTTFFFLFILLIVYMSKKNMDNIENKIYKLLIILSSIELFSYLISMLVDLYWPNMDQLFIVATRIRMTAEIFWFFLIDLYKIVILQHRNKDKFEMWYHTKKRKIHTIIFIILGIIGLLGFILPLNIAERTTNPLRHQADGICYIYWMLVFIVLVLIYFVLSIISIGRIEKKKVFPFIINDIFMLSAFFHPLFRDLSLPMVTRTLIVYIMYHTIENPDIKMVNELTLAKNQAEQSNNAKSDFLSSMSHELRTPLNAIVGLSQMIKEEANQEDVKNDAQDIMIASENLLELVNGILDINKIEANELKSVEVDYNPHEIFNDLSKMIKIRIGDKNIELKENFSIELPNKLHGDKDNIKRIISNLLTNAVKYTEEGSINFNVDCTIVKDKYNLIITVIDTGRGIAEDRIPTLFTKFNRLESDKDSDISGTGLGLAITKSLVDLLGGKISVNSTLGEGTTFTVTLSQKIIKDQTEEII